jgi:transcriptional regulator with XRE-family HTH domain
MPLGARRRTPGLRREEVAQLASIGTSWYIWLEQGRDVHPSPQVLESLAQALKLTPNERRHLFLLAGVMPPPSGSPSGEHVTPALQEVVNGLDPAPACALGRRWDYLAWNRAADLVFDIARDSSPYARNLLWQLFTDPVRRQRPLWEQLARSTLAEFRAVSTRYPGDQWLEELIEDLRRVSPEFRAWWPRHHDARRTLDGRKTIEHSRLGRLEFEHINLQVLNEPDVRIMIYVPLADTRARLERELAAAAAAHVPQAEAAAAAHTLEAK